MCHWQSLCWSVLPAASSSQLQTNQKTFCQLFFFYVSRFIGIFILFWLIYIMFLLAIAITLIWGDNACKPWDGSNEHFIIMLINTDCLLDPTVFRLTSFTFRCTLLWCGAAVDQLEKNLSRSCFKSRVGSLCTRHFIDTLVQSCLLIGHSKADRLAADFLE